MADVDIRREVRPAESAILALDTSLRSIISPRELEFLRLTISDDDEQLWKRVDEVQKEAYEAWPYPCIRAYHFVCLMMSKNAVYERVVSAGKEGETLLLDIGCCMGTDARKLVLDGYPAQNVLGCDLNHAFIDLGHKLYDDKDSCKIRFFTGDVLALPPPALVSASKPGTSAPVDLARAGSLSLSDLQFCITHIYTGALFHLFDEATQFAMALRVAGLLKRSPGATIFGRHQGLVKEGSIADHMSRVRYGHSPESWKAMWRTVFDQLDGSEFTAGRVKLEAVLEGNLLRVSTVYESRMMYWSVTIV